MVVLGCWCTSFASFGYVNSFGWVISTSVWNRIKANKASPIDRVYETYYLQTFLSHHSPSDVAWIGSIQAFAQFSAAIISGPIADRYGAMVWLIIDSKTN
jgi:MFS family permease